MMKQLLLLVLAIQFTFTLSDAQLFYPADSVPAHLRAGANAVIRNRQVKIDVIDEKHSALSFKLALTLLNENAEGYTIVSIPYSDLRKINKVRANAYNEKGKLIWTLRSFELYDFKDFSGPEFLDDQRKKVFEVPTYNYPFTIEYSFEMTMQDFFLSPEFRLMQDPETAVESSGLQCIIPDAVGFNFKGINLKNPTDSMRIGKKLVLSWLEENLPAQRQHVFAPSLSEKMPVIYATPIRTNLQGYKGSFATWHDYGLWMSDLIKGRDELALQYADAARKLVQNISGRRDKTKALYEYMQKNTRYFSVSFGIGGKQPIPANEVAKNGYGDCKALSNYMKALLKAVGIDSYYTLVLAGVGETIQEDFPCNQFNHAILCVPDQNDTIWLECTDPTSPFNYLGSFTSDRYVLTVTPEGGRLVKTPSYGRDFNSVKTYSEILMHGSGDARIRLGFTYYGLRYDELFAVSESKDDQRKTWLANLFGYAAFEIEDESFSFDRAVDVPTGKANYEILLRDLASKSSGRLYVSPCFITGVPYIWDDPGEIEVDLDSERSDSVRIEIPLGFAVEYLPGESHINTRFGEYSSSITSDDKFVYFSRKITFNKAVYPEEVFREFYDFITEIAIAERQMLVFKEVPDLPGTHL